LGGIATKLQGQYEFLLEVTKYIECPLHLDKKGLFLALAESYQHQKKECVALSLLIKLNDEIPEDKIVILSLLEISAVSNISTTAELTELLIKTKNFENNEPIDTNILYYRAYISYKLGLKDPAIEQLTKLLQKRKHRPDDLLLDIRYLRGRIYGELGNLKKSKDDYQTIYAHDPNFKDISTRLQ
jgi:tetratricopeptide (TPR) repeat protein